MHESSFLKDLVTKIESLARENGSSKVIGVKVKLGALTNISPDHLLEHFEYAVIDSVAEGARLEIEELSNMNDPHAQDIILDSIVVEES